MIGDERYHIIQDVPRGLIWISTYGNGLFVYDSQKEEMTHYSYHVDEFNRVNSDFLLYKQEYEPVISGWDQNIPA